MGAPAEVEDVAAALLERLGPLDTIKLQKLVYYVQAWHVTWRGTPLFNDDIEAWDNGPVVRRLFGMHRGAYIVSKLSWGDPVAIPPGSLPIVDFVCGYYGDKSGADLVLHVHEEDPWDQAYHEGGRNSIITIDAMSRYYGSLETPNDQAWFWTPGWQEGERAAESDIEAGRLERFTSAEDFLASL